MNTHPGTFADYPLRGVMRTRGHTHRFPLKRSVTYTYMTTLADVSLQGVKYTHMYKDNLTDVPLRVV